MTYRNEDWPTASLLTALADAFDETKPAQPKRQRTLQDMVDVVRLIATGLLPEGLNVLQSNATPVTQVECEARSLIERYREAQTQKAD